ncbi:4703_t:CDS:2 [Entrophospora sp. SA101]|nr:4703_t:CDS:2 [Entrophospora sp. SA101]
MHRRTPIIIFNVKLFIIFKGSSTLAVDQYRGACLIDNECNHVGRMCLRKPRTSPQK